MKLCDSKTLCVRAREQGYAVPAFNTNGATCDITRAAVEIAEEMRSPLILQTYEPNCAYRGFDYMFLQAVHLIQGATIPVALHLDHGASFASALKAVKAGYTSIMIDGSHLPLEENIQLTRKVVEALQPLGITVEAEVGHVAGGVHSNGHHGASTTDPADARLARSGMAKINFGEPFRANYIQYFKEYADTLDHKDHPWKIMWAVKDRLEEDMRLLIAALGSEGKAD